MTIKRMVMTAVALVFSLATALTASAAIPAGYTEVEYIQGDDRSGTETGGYFLTDYRVRPLTMKLEADLTATKKLGMGDHDAVWCARTDSSTNMYTVLLRGSSSAISPISFYYLLRIKTIKKPNNTDFPVVADHRYTITGNGRTLSVVDNTDDSTGSCSFDADWDDSENGGYTGGKLCLFATYTAADSTTGAPTGDATWSNYCSYKLHSFKVWENDTLIHHYVPVVRDADKQPMLYDVVADAPFGPTSGGSYFIAGPEPKSAANVTVTIDSVDTTYATLKEAMAYVYEQNVDATVVINENLVETDACFAINSAQRVTIDLNGCTVSNTYDSAAFDIAEGGALTVQDSAGGGKYYAVGCNVFGIH